MAATNRSSSLVTWTVAGPYSRFEAGMTSPGERPIALLAGVFKLEPRQLVAGTFEASAPIVIVSSGGIPILPG